MKVLVTAHYADGRERIAVVEPEEAASAMRDLVFRLTASTQIVSVTVTKADLVTRLMDGRLKLAGPGQGPVR